MQQPVNLGLICTRRAAVESVKPAYERDYELTESTYMLFIGEIQRSRPPTKAVRSRTLFDITTRLLKCLWCNPTMCCVVTKRAAPQTHPCAACKPTMHKLRSLTTQASARAISYRTPPSYSSRHLGPANKLHIPMKIIRQTSGVYSRTTSSASEHSNGKSNEHEIGTTGLEQTQIVLQF